MTGVMGGQNSFAILECNHGYTTDTGEDQPHGLMRGVLTERWLALWMAEVLLWLPP